MRALESRVDSLVSWKVRVEEADGRACVAPCSVVVVLLVLRIEGTSESVSSRMREWMQRWMLGCFVLSKR